MACSTIRPLLLEVVSMKHSHGPYLLGHIVIRDLVTIERTATTEQARAKLRDQRIGGLAVVDPRGGVCGALSARDLLHADGPQVRVDTLMTPTVFTARADVAVTVAARLMADGGLHRLFVEEHGKIIGIVTLTDIARLVARAGLSEDDANVRLEVPLMHVISVDKPRDVFVKSLNRCGDTLARIFYEKFLNSSADVKERFALTDMRRQEKKITQALHLAADVVMNDPAALAKLTRQAEHHDRHHLNIPPELYVFWLEALIAAVRDCDAEFDPGVEYAWRLLMGHVIHRMTSRY